MVRADTRLGRLILALAGRPASTTTSVPIRTSTRWAAALGSRPIATVAAPPSGPAAPAVDPAVTGSPDASGNDQAIEALERALTIYQSIGDRLGQATTLIDLGRARQASGDYALAASHLEQALIIRREVGDRVDEAPSLVELGGLQVLTGDYSPAAATLERALTIYQEIGDRPGQAKALTHLGRLLVLAGHTLYRGSTGWVHDDFGASPLSVAEEGERLSDRVAAVVAKVLETTPDKLRTDADGAIAIPAGTAMVFVRVHGNPPLVDVFSPLVTDVAPR